MDKSKIPYFGIYGSGFVDWLYDEMELGARVAHFPDSENNTPGVHFFDLGEVWND